MGSNFIFNFNSGQGNMLGKIIELTKKYGYGAVIFALLVFLVFTNVFKTSFQSADKYKEYILAEQQVHDDGLNKRANADMIIPSMLDNLRITLHADRVMLLEFHNGGNNVANLPFRHFSATYESVDDSNPNVERIADDYYYQRPSDYINLLKQLKTYNYIFIPNIKDIKDKYPRLYAKIYPNKVKSIYISEINGLRTPTGIITITSQSDTLDLNAIQRVVPPYIQKLSQLLEGIATPKL